MALAAHVLDMPGVTDELASRWVPVTFVGLLVAVDRETRARVLACLNTVVGELAR